MSTKVCLIGKEQKRPLIPYFCAVAACIEFFEIVLTPKLTRNSQSQVGKIVSWTCYLSVAITLISSSYLQAMLVECNLNVPNRFAWMQDLEGVMIT